MDFFTTTSEGFSANIKAQPEHFQVTEISYFENNSHITKDAVEKPSSKRKSNPTFDSVSCDSKKVKGSGENNAAHTDQKETEPFLCDIEWCREKLQSILDVSMVKTLESVAKIDVPQSIANSDLGATGSFPLGEFTDKSLRTVIHMCVRYVFPQLKTITNPGTAFITVQLCDIHKDFSSHLDMGLVNNLIRYAMIETLFDHSKTFTIKNCDSKEHRRQTHHMINKYWGKCFETKTMLSKDEKGSSVIAIRRKSHPARKVDHQSSCFTSFKLWKCNTETQAAIEQLSRHFFLRPHMFHFAGTKDKRAITVQTLTVASISPIKVQELGKTLPKNLKISDAQAVPRHIRLGELNGNKFVIILSNVSCLPSRSSITENIEAVIDKALAEVVKNGFVNLFGPQRFGRHISGDGLRNLHEVKLEAPAIGLAMLLKDFRRAVKILLQPRDASPSEIETSAGEVAKRYYLETEDVQGAINLMPLQKTREIAVLKSLRRFGTSGQDSYAKAILSLPHQSRLFYIHSYCSWIWNQMATLRLIRFGCKVCEGDLILSNQQSSNNTDDMEKVVVVTTQDVASSLIRLQDIVLPTPGNQIRYPPNLEKDYLEIMQKHCILADERSKDCKTTGNCGESTTNFRISELKINIPGAYRRLIEYPRNLSHRHLQKNQIDPSNVSVTSESMVESSTLSNDVELVFDLAPSSYATVLLHEITKGNCR